MVECVQTYRLGVNGDAYFSRRLDTFKRSKLSAGFLGLSEPAHSHGIVKRENKESPTSSLAH